MAPKIAKRKVAQANINAEDGIAGPNSKIYVDCKRNGDVGG